MNNKVQKLVEEHAQIVSRISVFQNEVTEACNESNSVYSKVEFANMCIQLSSMKKYEESLRARIENNGVFFQEGQYFERVASIVTQEADNTKSSDDDIDEEENSKPDE